MAEFCVVVDLGLVCEGYTRGQLQGLIIITGLACTFAGILTLVLIKQRLIRISTILLALALWFFVLATILSDAPRLTQESLTGTDRTSIALRIMSLAATLSYQLYVLSAMLSCFTVDMHAISCAAFGVAAAAAVGLGIAPPWIANHAPGGREVYVTSDQQGLFDGMVRGSVGANLACHLIVLVAIWRFRQYALFDETLDDQFSSIFGVGVILGIISDILALASPHHYPTILLRRALMGLELVFYLFYIIFGGYTLRPPWALQIADDWQEDGEYRDSASYDEYIREPERGGAGKYNTLASNPHSRATSEFGRSRAPSEHDHSPPRSRRPSMRNSPYAQDHPERRPSLRPSPYSQENLERFAAEVRASDRSRKLTPNYHPTSSYNDHRQPDYSHSHSHHHSSHPRDRQAPAGRHASGYGSGRATPYGRNYESSRDSFESVESYHDAPTPDSHELVDLSREPRRYRDESFDEVRSPRRAVVYGTTDATAQMAERRTHRMDRESGLMISSRRLPGGRA